MEFVAVDVETANADMATICQVGLAHYLDGEISQTYSTLVDPEDDFDGVNVAIHGIDEAKVRGAPNLPKVAEIIRKFIGDKIAVCHTHFDRVAFRQAYERYSITPLSCQWLDSARVARRTWEEFATRGYGLTNVCKKIGVTYRPHDALEDAKAAAAVVLAASELTGLDLDGWLRRVKQPIGGADSGSRSIKLDGDPNGALYGELIVFTGALEIPRREAAALAAKIGCAVGPGVTMKTSILVVGDQDIQKLNGHKKSSKHRKAEELIAKGAELRILRETDFKRLVELYAEDI